MLIEMLRVTVNFMIDLLSGNLPVLYYGWMALLLAVHVLQLTVTFYVAKPGKTYSRYFAECTAAFAVLILAGILISKFLAFIVEDAFIRFSGFAHDFISLVIATIFVVTEAPRLLLLRKINNPNLRFVMTLALVLAANTLCFVGLLPLTDALFEVSTAFMTTLIVAVSLLMLVLIHFEDKAEPAVSSGKGTAEPK